MNRTAVATAANPGGWSEEQVRALLRDNQFGYQRIALPYGLATPGHDRSATAQRIFPASLAGCSVFDLGCQNGYFAFEAMARGATRAVGVDIDEETLRKAALLADCLGRPVEFRLLDIERDSLDERFDYVLALNVLHHLKNPLAALDKLIAATRQCLVLEVATVGRRDRRKLGLSWLSSWLLARTPAMLVNPRRGRSLQTFFITPSALHNLLMRHRKCFASVQIEPSEHKDRYIAVAHKRRIGHLLLVSGPTGSGKSTLIERLTQNALPALAAELDLGDGASWTVTSVSRLAQVSEPAVPKLIFHYDFLWRYPTSAGVEPRDEYLDIVDCAERVTILTIWTPPSVLRRQHEQHEITPMMRGGKFRGRARQLQIQKMYADEAAVRGHYRAWLAITRRWTATHRIISFSGMDYTLTDTAEWERTAAET